MIMLIFVITLKIARSAQSPNPSTTPNPPPYQTTLKILLTAVSLPPRTAKDSIPIPSVFASWPPYFYVFCRLLPSTFHSLALLGGSARFCEDRTAAGAIYFSHCYRPVHERA
jgi:hypothetical protein